MLVHRRELLEQWRERLQSFLALDARAIGTIGGGKSKATGQIDVAMLQSVAPDGIRGQLLQRCGHVIVDECHHVSADSFEAVLKGVNARYVLSLTATPVRRDSQQPVMFMLCGPNRHAAKSPAGAPQVLEVFPQRLTSTVDVAADAPIQAVFAQLAQDTPRTQMIAAAVREQYGQGRNVLVLTERTDHLESLQQMLQDTVQSLFVLHGRLGRKARATQLAVLDALHRDTPRVVLATGRLVGEGFDHPALDTLVLGMPVRLEGHAAAVRRPAAPRACRQDWRAGARLCRRRPSDAAAHVGETPARLPGDGLPGMPARRGAPAGARLKSGYRSTFRTASGLQGRLSAHHIV
ncbi:DEAD/DEAH box helicase [Paraburkholderia tagetis]|uniref:DEAD/DEAH box helicase n=1 Tax=Paraburkholderia tagetis TaxID=2913261 RepID=UPI003084132E